MLLLAFGLGMLIFVHELGHFLAAKLVGIKVEVFALGFGPRLLGFTRGETDYRVSAIPLGGYIKMLGQDDLDPTKQVDDKRAFCNKSVGQRFIVIAAGVVMNIICALVVFGFLFGHGNKRPAPVVGYVNPDKPAAHAGIQGGDEVLAIDGKKCLSHMNLKIAAAFADPGQKVALTVRHPNGQTATYDVVPQPPQTDAEKEEGLKLFGIGHSYQLLISADLRNDPEILEDFRKMGFAPGDRIVAVNGLPIERYDQLHQQLNPLPGEPVAPAVSLGLERTLPDGRTTQKTVQLNMELAPAGQPEIIGTLLGMTPRSRVLRVTPDSPAQDAGLLKDDVILRMGPINNPTAEEFIEYCQSHGDQDVELLVSRRVDGPITQTKLTVVPRIPQNTGFLKRLLTDVSIQVGIIIGYDLEQPVVAKLSEHGAETFTRLTALPRGAHVLSVASEPVNNWTSLMTQLAAHQGQDVDITFAPSPDQPAQTVNVTLPDDHSWAGFASRPDLGDYAFLPLDPLQVTIKGKSWLENLNLGLDTTFTTLATSYLTIKGMIQGQFGTKSLSGPVGILKMSYTIASERDLGDYVFFMAFISVCVAFFNIMPLPILDGGHLVFLLIERVKGSPVSPKIQEVVAYVGIFLIGGLFLLLTYQDVIKWVSG